MNNELPSIAGVRLVKPEITTERITALLWGKVGVGKTILGMTMPPPILYILFDTDGYKSVTHVTDRYDMYDMTKVSNAAIDQFALYNSTLMTELDALLATKRYKSVLFDSLTAFLERALTRGVEIGAKRVTKGEKPDIFFPGLVGYGARANLIRLCVLNLHNLCAKYNINLCFTAHEKTEVNNEGVPTAVTLMLGGEALIQVPKNISEVLLLRYLPDVNQHRIYTRPWHLYEPMRTRMFKALEAPYFTWKFDPEKFEGPGMFEHWIERWRQAEGLKITPTE